MLSKVWHNCRNGSCMPLNRRRLPYQTILRYFHDCFSLTADKTACTSACLKSQSLRRLSLPSINLHHYKLTNYMHVWLNGTPSHGNHSITRSVSWHRWWAGCHWTASKPPRLYPSREANSDSAQPYSHGMSHAAVTLTPSSQPDVCAVGQVGTCAALRSNVTHVQAKLGQYSNTESNLSVN